MVADIIVWRNFPYSATDDMNWSSTCWLDVWTQQFLIEKSAFTRSLEKHYRNPLPLKASPFTPRFHCGRPLLLLNVDTPFCKNTAGTPSPVLKKCFFQSLMDFTEALLPAILVIFSVSFLVFQKELCAAKLAWSSGPLLHDNLSISTERGKPVTVSLTTARTACDKQPLWSLKNWQRTV